MFKRLALWPFVCVATAVVAALAGVAVVTSKPTASLAGDRTLPVKAVFYYPWFPETWHASDHYIPALGKYDSSNAAVFAAHVAAMRYAGLDAAIISWWGRGTPTDTRLPMMLDVAAAQGFDLTPYYEPEGTSDPSVAVIQSDLVRLGALATRPGWLHVAGKPVLFVYNANDTSCAVVDRWRQTAGAAWYLQMKVFPGYATCATQPDGWHQYGPATSYQTHGSFYANVSPGFWHYAETAPRLARNLDRFKADLSREADAPVAWQLVTSFNEWGEGTSVEAATQWQSPSGFGSYIDAMRTVFVFGQRFGGGSPSPSAPASPSTSPSAGVSPSASPSTSPTQPAALTVVAAGDIACEPASAFGTWSCAHDRTATLIESLNPTAVLTLGDNQYDNGALSKFQSVHGYGGTWGRLLAKTYPAPGNHEWGTANAQGYRDYYKASPAGAANIARLYYSFDLSGWHFVSLESDCSHIGGCAPGNPEYEFLRADLAANDGKPTVVYWHHPRYGNGTGDHGDNVYLAPMFDLLVADKDVQVQLNGHVHRYLRYAPMGRTGPDAAGLRVIAAGTGGKDHSGCAPAKPGLEVINCDTFGVLKLTLNTDGSWAWQFVPAPGTGTFTDSGSQSRRA